MAAPLSGLVATTQRMISVKTPINKLLATSSWMGGWVVGVLHGRIDVRYHHIWACFNEGIPLGTTTA
jgi:hypothetical protein